MGPRSIDRGIEDPKREQVITALLQWGRDQLIAEFQVAVEAVYEQTALQWGRDQLIAEFLRCTYCPRMFLWLQWGRDQLIAELAAPLSYSVFKGLGCRPRAPDLRPMRLGHLPPDLHR